MSQSIAYFFIMLSWTLTQLNGQESAKSYEGYSTYDVTVRNASQSDVLHKLRNSPGVHFWSAPVKKGKHAVMLAPEVKDKFLSTLRKNFISFKASITDVAKSLAEEKRNHTMTTRRSWNAGFLDPTEKYLSYEEMVFYLTQLATKHRDIILVETIGRTVGGHDILMVKISNNFFANKPIAMIEAGAHAREWLGPAMAFSIINTLVNRREYLEKTDWYIIPSLNPDGYVYSYTTDRFWRKNRAWNANLRGDCVGVDINRNFDADWERSDNPCEETYAGQQALSERESMAVAQVAYAIRPRLHSYLSVHSYGGLILYPYGFKNEIAPNGKNMAKCGYQARKIILNNGGPRFRVGNTAKTLYPSPGGSDDFIKLKMNAPYAYTVELPGGGKQGFDFPESQLQDILRKTTPGVMALAQCFY